VFIKTERSDKTEIKKFFLKISGHQLRWSGSFPGAILILPALLVVADLFGPEKRCRHKPIGCVK
jgi:hypothetical protein